MAAAVFGCAASSYSLERKRESSEQASGHRRMLALLEQVRERTSEEHLYLSDRTARGLRARLAGLGPSGPALIRWELHLKLGEAEQMIGREQEAIQHFTEAYRRVLGTTTVVRYQSVWPEQLRYRGPSRTR